jgi:hypothetical protein
VVLEEEAAAAEKEPTVMATPTRSQSAVPYNRITNNLSDSLVWCWVVGGEEVNAIRAKKEVWTLKTFYVSGSAYTNQLAST